METNIYFSEHLLVLKYQEEVVKEVEKITDKFGEMEVLSSLQSADKILCALASRMEKINVHIAEYKRICSQISPGYMEEIQRLFSDQENYVGMIERDGNGNIHCGNSLVPYKYCQDLVGKKVRLSFITLNVNNNTRKLYPTFAKHIDVVEE